MNALLTPIEIDGFLDLSHKSLVNYIQIDLDANLNTKNVDLNYCDFSPFDKNDYWMEDWMEQSCSFKEARNYMLLQEHHSDDFCYYVEAID